MYAYIEINLSLPVDDLYNVSFLGQRTLLGTGRITNNTKLSTIKQ